MKVLIVDDELVIRRGLKNKIERIFSNITSVTLAEDAFQALELMAIDQPDVVITDIRMPEMNGLAFIEQSKKLCPKTKFIIISGYQEFEYAKEAIKLNVEDYLIKPIENEKLKGVLERIQNQFMLEHQEEQQLHELKSTMKKAMSFLRSKHLTDLVEESQHYKWDEYQQLLEKVEVRFPFPCFTIITIELNANVQLSNFPDKEDLPLVKFIINNIAEEVMNEIGKCIAFEDNKNSQLTHLIFNHAEFVDENRNNIIQDSCKKLLNEVYKCLKVYVTIGIGSKVENYQALHSSYVDAGRALKKKFSLSESKIFCSKNEMENFEPFYLLSEEKEKTFIQYIKNAYASNAKQIIEEVFDNIEKQGVQYSNLVMLYMDLMLLMIKSIKELGICFTDIFKEDIMTEEYVSSFSDINDLKAHLLMYIDSICSYLIEFRKSDGERTVEHLMDYIQQNYYMDLHLSELSELYYMNSSYLSQLFKKETGKGFSDYLTEIRMENAKKLLDNTQFKAYEISEMVGYNNPKYFLRAFLKCCGCTPTQYRLRVINKN